MDRRQSRRLAYALLGAPLIIAFPLWWKVLRDPSTLRENWDSWLLFVVLPVVLGAILLLKSGKTRKENGSA